MLLYLSLCVYYIYLYVSILLTRSFFFVFAEEKNFEFVYYLNVPLEKRFERRKHCETKHVISYFVNKKNKKGRNVDSLFNTWMFHTNVIRRIHDMYKKKAEKKEGEPSSNKFILLEHTGWHEFLSCVFSHLSTSHANRDYR